MSEQGPAGVVDAYFAQFQEDFNGFLRGRANEVVKGGRMFLAVNGRLSADRRHLGTAAVYWKWLGSAIEDLVSQVHSLIPNIELRIRGFSIFYF